MIAKFYPYLFLFFLLSFSSCSGVFLKTVSTPSLHHMEKSAIPQRGWKQMAIYDQLAANDRYEILATVVATGSENTTEEILLKELSKEASKYQADALLHVETRKVKRHFVNGLAAAFNVVNIGAAATIGCLDDEWHEIEGDYIALEVEALAIRFLPANSNQ